MYIPLPFNILPGFHWQPLLKSYFNDRNKSFRSKPTINRESEVRDTPVASNHGGTNSPTQ